MKSSKIALFLTLAFIPCLLLADDDPSYTYFDASYVDYDVDFSNYDVSADGYKLKLSVNLLGGLFAQIDRSQTDGDGAEDNFDFDREGYGFGLHGSYWYASYTYNTWEIDDGEFDIDTLRVGLRTQWTDHIEFNASYSWNDIEDMDDGDGFQVGLVYQLTDFLHLTAEFETIGEIDVDQLSVGIRFNL